MATTKTDLQIEKLEEALAEANDRDSESDRLAIQLAAAKELRARQEQAEQERLVKVAALRETEEEQNDKVLVLRDELSDALDALGETHVALHRLGERAKLGDTILFQMVHQSKRAAEFRQSMTARSRPDQGKAQKAKRPKVGKEKAAMLKRRYGR